MGKQQELAAHIKGALNNGVTEVELRCVSRESLIKTLEDSLFSCSLKIETAYREVLLQVMVYTGMPNGLEAFRTADAAIQAWKAENPTGSV